MTPESKKWFVIAVFAVILAIAVSSSNIWFKRDNGNPVVINQKLSAAQEFDAYIHGAVNRSGIYPLYSDDTLGNIIEACGGLSEEASSRIELDVLPSAPAVNQPQKIDINRAETWLLKALPGVGEARAQAVIKYRTDHGLFRSILEIKNVPGFGDSLFSQIQDLISVSD